MKKSRYDCAIGLSQESARSIPQVGVRGEGPEADVVVSLARRFGVPIVEDPRLVSALRLKELDEAIPAELFFAVATLLERLDSLDSK